MRIMRYFIAIVVMSSALFVVAARRTDTEENEHNHQIMLNEMELLKQRVDDLEEYRHHSFQMIQRLQTQCTRWMDKETIATEKGVVPKSEHLFPFRPELVQVHEVEGGYKYTLDYKADVQPNVEWTVGYAYMNTKPFVIPQFESTYNGSHGFTSASSKLTTVRVNLVQPEINCALQMAISAKKYKNKIQNFTEIKFDFVPHMEEIVFDKDKNVSFEIVVNKEMHLVRRLEKYSTFVAVNTSDYTLPPVSYSIPNRGPDKQNGTAPLEIGEPTEYLEEQRIKYNINTMKTNKEGLLVINLWYEQEFSSMVNDLAVTRVIQVRRSDHEVVFPEGYLQFMGRNQAHTTIYCTNGESCTIHCSVLGINIKTFDMLKNGKILTVTSLKVIFGYFNTRTYGLETFTNSDVGKYVCRVSNEQGKVIEQATQVLLRIPLEFIKESSGIVSRDGDTLTVSCTARGRPKPEVAFYTNYQSDSEKMVDGLGSITIVTEELGNHTTRSILVLNISEVDGDFHQIICEANSLWDNAVFYIAIDE